MKMLATAFSAILMMSQLAFAKTTYLEFNGSVTGKVKFQTKWTVTCAAIGCPPSVAYTQVSLVDAKVDGFGNIPEVILSTEGASKRFPPQASYVTIQGTRLRPGLKVKVVGKTLVSEYSFIEVVYAQLTEVQSVKVVR